MIFNIRKNGLCQIGLCAKAVLILQQKSSKSTKEVLFNKGKYLSIDFRCRRNSIEKNEVEVGTINFKFVGFTTANKSFFIHLTILSN